MIDPAQLFPFRKPQAAPALRLVCLPFAGGAASLYRAWPKLLAPDIEVCPVELPGRGLRFGEPVLTDMPALCDHLAPAIERLLDRPLALFGHSMGALLAFEVAVRLEQRHGTAPVRLFVSGRPAPHLATPTSLHLADEQTLVTDVARLGTPDRIVFDDPDLRSLVLPALRDDYRLVETHAFDKSRRVGPDIVAYGGDRDPACRIGALRNWAELTAGGFRQRIFPGDHFYLAPCEPAVVADVAGDLEGAGLFAAGHS